MGWIEELYYKEQVLKMQDFYYEKGYKVMTEKYHLKRGYCCQSNCRHCPYKKEDKKKSDDRY